MSKIVEIKREKGREWDIMDFILIKLFFLINKNIIPERALITNSESNNYFAFSVTLIFVSHN